MTLDKINAALNNGGVALLPTETVFGLACRAMNKNAVDKIYAIKGREFDKPLAVCVHSLEQAEDLGTFNPLARKIAHEYWPGPVTVIVKAKPGNGLDPRCFSRVDGEATIALRCPDASWRDRLDGPLALTSANRSGEPDCVDYASALALLGTEIDGHIENEIPLSGQASTIISVNEEGLKTLRQGSVNLAGLTI